LHGPRIAQAVKSFPVARGKRFGPVLAPLSISLFLLCSLPRSITRIGGRRAFCALYAFYAMNYQVHALASWAACAIY
jgi:hypothetical protein